MRKERLGTFQAEAKEPVIERIAQLARRYASRSAAAREWGININTLNSYFKSDSTPPMPRENVLQRIADSENVSLQWLTTGMGTPPKSPKSPSEGVVRDELTDMLSFLTIDERKQLAVMLARKGVDTTIQLLLEFSNLSPSQLERVIRLAQQTREGVIEDDPLHELTGPTHKQAG